MSIYLRQSYGLPKKFVIFNRTPSLKFFSPFSSISNSFRSNANKFSYTKLIHPKPLQSRRFSLQNVYSFYDSLSSSEASKIFRQILIDFHEFTGLSWSFTILASSVFMKLVVSLPCAVYQQYLIAKLELVKTECKALTKSLKEKLMLEAYKKKWTKEKLVSAYNQKIKEQWNILIVKNNCHPFKITILFFTQLPFWLILTLTIRKIAIDASRGHFDSPVDSLLFQVGGPFWSRNLALPDPTYILPIINYLCLMAVIEISNFTEMPEKITGKSVRFYFIKIYKNFLRLLGLIMFIVSALSPSGVSLFWASNSVISLAQKFLIMSPRTRRFFKIPKTPSEIDKPYSQTWNKFLEKFTKLFSKK